MQLKKSLHINLVSLGEIINSWVNIMKGLRVTFPPFPRLSLSFKCHYPPYHSSQLKPVQRIINALQPMLACDISLTQALLGQCLQTAC